MKLPFDIGDILIRIGTADKYLLESYHAQISKIKGWTVSYCLRNMVTGSANNVDELDILYYKLDTASSFNVTLPTAPQHIKVSMVGGGGGCGIDSIPISIDIQDVDACDHQYVTWTGLHGTITDCTKCKKVKHDNK
jgi:hypothetical protein